MVLACDMRISVPEASFFYPVVKLGYLPQPSDALRLSKICGSSRAKLILLAGQKLTCKTAYEFGLVDEIVAGNNILSRIDGVFRHFKFKRGQISAIKEMIP